MGIERHSISSIIRLVVLAGLLTLSACGGGSSENSLDTYIPPDDSNGDTTPPPDDGDDTYTLSDEQGIWAGTITTTSGLIVPPDVYDVVMIFHLPDGADEGRLMGAAFKQGSSDPGDHFLFDGGYEYARDLGLDFDLLVGTHGDHGSFLKEYDYLYGSQSDSSQRGKMELTVDDLSMTGNVVFAEYGGFTLAATYSSANATDTDLADLAALGRDATAEHKWTNNNTGGDMVVSDLAAGNLSVTQDATACNGNGMIADVNGYNLFIISSVRVADCNPAAPDTVPPIVIPDVDNDPMASNDVYDGLAILIENSLLTIMTDEGVVLYNEFQD